MDKLTRLDDNIISPDIIQELLLPSMERPAEDINISITDDSIEKYLRQIEKQESKLSEEEDRILSLIAEPVIDNLCRYNRDISMLIVNKRGIVQISIPRVDKLGKVCYLSSYRKSSISKELRKGNYVGLNINTVVKDNPYQNHIFAIPLFNNGQFLGYLACMAPTEELMNYFKRWMVIGSKIIESQYTDLVYFRSLINVSSDCTLVINDRHVIVNANSSAINLLGTDPVGISVSKLLANPFQINQLFDDNATGSTFSIKSLTEDKLIPCYKLTSQQLYSREGKNQYIVTFKKEANRKIIYTPQHDNFDRLIGFTPVMTDIKNLAMKIANKSATVLIQGETGTGKDVLAECIHQASGRSGSFIAINCGAITRELINSEFFGYEDGAFTGAAKGGKIGKFEEADKGTLFLDEVGELPLDIQTNLLRFLEDKKLTRIGSTSVKTIDVRLIAATNRNLKDAVRAGNFREDLYHRLNVINVVMPPLRERKDDISLLVSHFLTEISTKYDMRIPQISNVALELFNRYDWPGNIRELKNIMEKLILLADKGEIDVDDIYKVLDIQFMQANESEPCTLGEHEKFAIIKALEQHNGIISKAAASLNISRATLHKKINKYNISIKHNVNF